MMPSKWSMTYNAFIEYGATDKNECIILAGDFNARTGKRLMQFKTLQRIKKKMF
jgi:endonuclease/exonuclease/phosphatase (EEP) superfamily protein YafD